MLFWYCFLKFSVSNNYISYKPGKKKHYCEFCRNPEMTMSTFEDGKKSLRHFVSFCFNFIMFYTISTSFKALFNSSTWERQWLIALPAFVGNYALLQQLLVLVNTNCQPVAKLAVIQGVQHFEDVPPAEGKALKGLLLIVKVGTDEEGVSSPRHQDIIIG